LHGASPAIQPTHWGIKETGMAFTSVVFKNPNTGAMKEAPIGVFMFIYNKLYVKDLINDGYKAQSIAKGELGYASAKLGFDIPRLEGVAA
jgi:hypothetical protein